MMQLLDNAMEAVEGAVEENLDAVSNMMSDPSGFVAETIQEKLMEQAEGLSAQGRLEARLDDDNAIGHEGLEDTTNAISDPTGYITGKIQEHVGDKFETLTEGTAEVSSSAGVGEQHHVVVEMPVKQVNDCGGGEGDDFKAFILALNIPNPEELLDKLLKQGINNLTIARELSEADYKEIGLSIGQRITIKKSLVL